MKKIVLTYGLLAGLIIAVLMVAVFEISRAMGSTMHSMVLGYANMIIALSMIFFAIKNYRDNYAGGQIAFGRAFLVGLYVTIIASILYVIVWKIYSSIAMPDWVADYSRHVIDDMRKSGASETAIAQQQKEMADMAEMMKNPLVEIGMVFMEIFPVGLLISAISALILKKKKTVQPAVA